LSIISEAEFAADAGIDRQSMAPALKLILAVGGFAVAAFCWSFAVPLIGLAIFVAKFFAG